MPAGLVADSPRAPSVDDIPVHSICAVAGAIVRFSYFVSKRRGGVGFMKTSCTTSTNKHSHDALVAATKRGDTQAFEELVLFHQHRDLVVAQRVTSNREKREHTAAAR